MEPVKVDDCYFNPGEENNCSVYPVALWGMNAIDAFFFSVLAIGIFSTAWKIFFCMVIYVVMLFSVYLVVSVSFKYLTSTSFKYFGWILERAAPVVTNKAGLIKEMVLYFIDIAWNTAKHVLA